MSHDPDRHTVANPQDDVVTFQHNGQPVTMDRRLALDLVLEHLGAQRVEADRALRDTVPLIVQPLQRYDVGEVVMTDGDARLWWNTGMTTAFERAVIEERKAKNAAKRARRNAKAMRRTQPYPALG